ncbi:hypothetical protein [Neisseria animalis]|uniref:Uncharacterized protein n=1 Tax=Neisseria animalis TaxID=492 RepID=A0A5P3MSL4_NEIAN|nr:hypothetical protein [Neisseria animalis]QEY24606.1 hypothetical protein D0T90_09120 [Neisseria animalis]ROW32981.1 hypothetical protein CGZ60_01605 [Neisseria animalis]
MMAHHSSEISIPAKEDIEKEESTALLSFLRKIDVNEANMLEEYAKESGAVKFFNKMLFNSADFHYSISKGKAKKVSLAQSMWINGDGSILYSGDGFERYDAKLEGNNDKKKGFLTLLTLMKANIRRVLAPLCSTCTNRNNLL